MDQNHSEKASEKEARKQDRRKKEKADTHVSQEESARGVRTPRTLPKSKEEQRHPFFIKNPTRLEVKVLL
jgi:hypothetical protein